MSAIVPRAGLLEARGCATGGYPTLYFIPIRREVTPFLACKRQVAIDAAEQRADLHHLLFDIEGGERLETAGKLTVPAGRYTRRYNRVQGIIKYKVDGTWRKVVPGCVRCAAGIRSQKQNK